MKMSEIKPVSAWSAAFAAAFRARAKEAGVTQKDLGADTQRSQPYISDRWRGLRAVDTDMIDAAAKRMNIEPRDLVRAILRDIEPRFPGGVTFGGHGTKPLDPKG